MNSQTSSRLKKKKQVKLSGKSAAREILLLSTTASLSAENKERIQSLLSGKVDWDYLVNLAILHDIAPLIARNVTAVNINNQFPKPYLAQLDEIYHQTLYKNVIYSEELSKILSAFDQRAIPVIALKGITLAETLYENPFLRTTLDIDILVQLDDLARADSLLSEMGYTQTASPSRQPHPFHGAPYCRQAAIPIFIEVHWDLEDEKLMPISRQDIWRRAQIIEVQRGPTLTLSPEDTLMFSIVQLCKEFDELKILCDITALLKKYKDILDWRYIIGSALDWGIGAGAYYALIRARDILGAPVPLYVFKELKPEAWRRGMVSFLSNREAFVSRIKWSKLRAETLILVRGLMMKHARQTILILKKYRGTEKRGAWLRTAFWMILVFFAALGTNIARALAFTE